MENRRSATILGIIPQYPEHSKYNIYGKIRMPPVGIISVLSQVQHDQNLEVYAIDENNYVGPKDFMGMPDHGFLQERKQADMVLLYGGMSNSIPRMFSVAKQYKRFGAITIAGGSHVDALPEEALRSGIDIVVHGEGELIFKKILRAWKQEKGLDRNILNKIRGISFLDEHGRHIFTGKGSPITDLDKLEQADLTLIKHLRERWSAIPINRGRGCNFNCEFCVVNRQYGRYKAASVERAFQQVVKYSDLGYRRFFFTDDNFAQDPDTATELCKMIGDYKRRFRKKIRMIVQVRSEVAEDEKLIEAMRYAGVDMLAIGYESPVDEELKAMKKGVTVEKLTERSRKLSKHFYLHGMFIFGYPVSTDSEQKTRLTLKQRAKAHARFYKKAKIDTLQVLNAVPLPGSELRARLEKEGRLLPLETVGWDKYDGLFLCYVPEEGASAYELQNLPRLLMKKKYLGNSVISKINYSNWMDWAFNATVGFPVLFAVFYTKRFMINILEEKGKKRMEQDKGTDRPRLIPKRNIFHESMVMAWKDIRRIWRNLAIMTYGGRIVKRWFKTYRSSDYSKKIRKGFAEKDTVAARS
ncbi:radical SAM protein [Candidatus Woesearchaeota archaeon]|nr:radical SAM protein [Candidatus Woesearchaeota archaeon]